MTFRRWWRRWWRLNGDITGRAERAQADLRATQWETRRLAREGPSLAGLPPDEFTRRVYEAFGRRLT